MAMLRDNTQIPKKATRPAKTNNYSIVGIDFTKISENEKLLNVENNAVKRDISILSTELDKGVTIKAVLTQNQRKAIREYKEKEEKSKLIVKNHKRVGELHELQNRRGNQEK